MFLNDLGLPQSGGFSFGGGGGVRTGDMTREGVHRFWVAQVPGRTDVQ